MRTTGILLDVVHRVMLGQNLMLGTPQSFHRPVVMGAAARRDLQFHTVISEICYDVSYLCFSDHADGEIA